MGPDDELEKHNRLAAYGCFFLGLFIIVFILTTPGCGGNKVPPIDVSFWAGDSSKGGITRSQDKVTIECSNVIFDNYTCLTYEDVQKIYDTMLECQQWPMLATSKQIKRFVMKNPEVIQHVLYQRKGMEPFQR